jgi:hypothetical protein
VAFQVLTAANVKMKAFWDVASWSLVVDFHETTQKAVIFIWAYVWGNLSQNVHLESDVTYL